MPLNINNELYSKHRYSFLHRPKFIADLPAKFQMLLFCISSSSANQIMTHNLAARGREKLEIELGNYF